MAGEGSEKISKKDMLGRKLPLSCCVPFCTHLGQYMYVVW